MLTFTPPAIYQASKCYVTYGVMGHLDPKQPPSKGKPWATLTSQDFVHRADLLIPQDAFGIVWKQLVRDRPAPEFKRVVMSLHDILSGGFFTEYVKKRDIMMLSEGRRGIDSAFSLKSGMLTMLLDKETYERAGLVGKPHGIKGKRGLKPRWVVEFDLTSPSMFPGKKGFDRLIYASKNALVAPITWLFCNISSTTPEPDPLSQHFPTNYTCTPDAVEGMDVNIPTLKPSIESIAATAREDFEDFSTRLYEWLSLARLQCPRIETGDKIDPYLSRYQVPDGDEQQAKICKITWQGFLAPSWSRTTLIDIIAALPSRAWFSFSTTTFSKGLAGHNSECTILRPSDSSGEYIMWEIKAHE
ncbi:Ribonuclease P protein subunit p40 [Madurella mycetomatis]|uniref:Ribonuclease P protein subunit p40 n=1 Tax=Madurella mycetomatis TaxID=100816 RepID=A0A175WCF8_9PEZI|nr:Ribonuclease P protein subunit p40 [Madurella mycetomatis]